MWKRCSNALVGPCAQGCRGMGCQRGSKRERRCGRNDGHEMAPRDCGWIKGGRVDQKEAGWRSTRPGCSGCAKVRLGHTTQCTLRLGAMIEGAGVARSEEGDQKLASSLPSSGRPAHCQMSLPARRASTLGQLARFICLPCASTHPAAPGWPPPGRLPERRPGRCRRPQTCRPRRACRS